jgi:hypothetical protein
LDLKCVFLVSKLAFNKFNSYRYNEARAAREKVAAVGLYS